MTLQPSLASLLRGSSSSSATGDTLINTTATTYNESFFATILSHHNLSRNDMDYMMTVTSTVVDAPVYCDEAWTEFRDWFLGVHLVVSPIVCVFGLITNILNIIVLTRKDMVSPTNTILTGLAVADMLVMIDYLPFTLLTAYSYIQTHCARYSYGSALFTLFHAHLSVVCHTVSIGLTLTLAVWRFIAVTFPQNNRDWCNMRRAIIAVISCYIFTPFFCIPMFFAIEIREHHSNCSGLPADQEDEATAALNYVYHVQTSEIAQKNGLLLQNLNLWVYAVLIKLLPCAVLTVLSVCLIRALYKANERRVQLKSRSVPEENPDRSCDRTTRMLLAVLLLFLITEFPQGILAMLSGLVGPAFFEQCYINLSEVMDLLALINSAINFILYCVMSRQFRNTFNHLFKPNILNNWIAIPQDANTQMTTCV